MKETQHCNKNSFPWHMVDSKWNAVARDGDYPVWYLHEERPDINKSTQTWDSQDCACFSRDAQKVIGTDMSQRKDIPWEESLMLRPGYQEKKEDGNCDEVPGKEEADHSVNSVKEYPVVKMKELRNYTIGDVVRLKKTGELVEITVWTCSEDCDCCAMYEVSGCYDKTNCDDFPVRVCFHKVKD